ncbi:chorismate mutase [Streptomyces sp. NPDC101132]|uniref:chorismate mutase n=1 Tax=Streptomyces sp. NPDC101132 TaxID=3366110 RepID=UPI0037FBBEE3
MSVLSLDTAPAAPLDPVFDPATGVRAGAHNATEAVEAVLAHRAAIDDADRRLIELIKERCRLSGEVQKARISSGGPRIVRGREQRIVGSYEAEFGVVGQEFARLLLELGRGRP